MEEIFFTAVLDNKVLKGKKGQVAFNNKGSLKKSIAQKFLYLPNKPDYQIIEFTLADILLGIAESHRENYNELDEPNASNALEA